MNESHSEMNEEKAAGHLLIVWTSGDPEIAHKMVFMYAYNAQKNGWWDQVTLLIWGPSSKLASEDAKIRESLKKMQEEGVELLAYPDTGRSNLHFLLAELSNRGISQLLVEGGPTLLTSFLKENLADEIIIYIAPKILGSQSSIGITKPMAELSQAVDLHNVEVERFGDDVCFRGLTEKAIGEISSAPESNFEIYTVSEPVNE